MVRTQRNAVAVPVAVVLHDADDVIAVRVHKLRPRLPQRMYNVVDETDLQLSLHRVSKNYAKLFLSELRQISTNFNKFRQRDGKEADIM